MPFSIVEMEAVEPHLPWRTPRLVPELRFDFLPKVKGMSRLAHLRQILTEYSNWHQLPASYRGQFEGKVADQLKNTIKHAFFEMILAHRNQYRKTREPDAKKKEPYSIHPTHVAFWAAKAGLPCRAVKSALLHDAVEDSGVTNPLITLDSMRQKFGMEVAYQVYRLTKPKFRNGKIVFGWDPAYNHAETDEDVRLKNDEGHRLIEAYQRHLFKGEGYDPKSEPPVVKEFLAQRGYDPRYLNELDFEAIQLKGLDLVHNEKTRGNLTDEKQKHLTQKQLDFGLIRFLEALHPGYLDSIPEAARAHYRSQLNYPRHYPYLTELASRDEQNFETLKRQPPTTAPTINFHPGVDAQGKPYVDCLFPHEIFGVPGDRLGEDDPYLRIFTELAPLSRMGTSIQFERSKLAPGFQGKSFEALRIYPGEVPMDQIRRTMRHIFLNHATHPFASDAHDFHVAGLYGAFHADDRHHLSVFAPVSRFPLNLASDDAYGYETRFPEEIRAAKLDDLGRKLAVELDQTPGYAIRHIGVAETSPNAEFVRLDMVLPEHLRHNEPLLNNHLAGLSHFLSQIRLDAGALEEHKPEEEEFSEPGVRVSKRFKRQRHSTAPGAPTKKTLSTPSKPDAHFKTGLSKQSFKRKGRRK